MGRARTLWLVWPLSEHDHYRLPDLKVILITCFYNRTGHDTCLSVVFPIIVLPPPSWRLTAVRFVNDLLNVHLIFIFILADIKTTRVTPFVSLSRLHLTSSITYVCIHVHLRKFHKFFAPFTMITRQTSAR